MQTIFSAIYVNWSHQIFPSVYRNTASKSGLADWATSPANPLAVRSSQDAIWTVRSGLQRVSHPLSRQPGRSRTRSWTPSRSVRGAFLSSPPTAVRLLRTSILPARAPASGPSAGGVRAPSTPAIPLSRQPGPAPLAMRTARLARVRANLAPTRFSPSCPREQRRARARHCRFPPGEERPVAMEPAQGPRAPARPPPARGLVAVVAREEETARGRPPHLDPPSAGGGPSGPGAAALARRPWPL